MDQRTLLDEASRFCTNGVGCTPLYHVSQCTIVFKGARRAG
jgi:hypothetical protein